MNIVQINEKNVQAAAEVYVEAYSKEPWNEIYEIDKVISYIMRFLLGNTNYGWILKDYGKPIGIMLGTIIPTVGSDYFRIEDLCILSSKQNLGYGSEFIKLLSTELIKRCVDSILLNTMGGFPAYSFYVKNNFNEVTTSKMLYLDLNNNQRLWM